jgi:hypothetical protein
VAKSVVRGKALVAQLRKRPDVRDAEALAAWIGRVKKLKRGGMSTKAAMKAAGGESSTAKLIGAAEEKARTSGDLEAEFGKQYENLFAGQKEGGITMADRMPLRRGMEVQFKDRPTPGDKNPEVVKVHGPNEVEVRMPDGTRKKVPRTNLLLVLPKHYGNKKKK